MPNLNAETSNLSSSSDEGHNDDDEDGNNWQQVPPKRKYTGSPNILNEKRFHLDDGPSTCNRFGVLATNEPDDNNNETAENTTKPPPIFIPHVQDIAKMVNKINQVIPNLDYHFKSLRDGQVRLVVKKVESYRKLVKYFDSAKCSYHTFQLKQDRAFRVVIKGLHHSTPISDIKAMLLSMGHQVRSVRNIVSRATKEPLPMFFVDLDPGSNNKEIYHIKSLDNAIISVEAPKKFDDIVQCHRCQDFGHTKSYCKKNFRCVKCGADHATSECTKLPNIPPKCVHCSQQHTANYRGCSIYQKLLHTRLASTNKGKQPANNISFTRPDNGFQSIPQSVEPSNFTYAQVLRNNDSGVTNILEKIEAMLAKQIELTNTLMNMMSMIMTKLCK